MKYKAFLHFKLIDNDKEYLRNTSLPVSAIMVDGGANRRIDFDSTDDISLTSELEQARSLENIIVYLSATGDDKDRRAAVDLIKLYQSFQSYRAITLVLTVERYAGKKMIEGISLRTQKAYLKHSPQNAFNNTLVSWFTLREVEIFQGKVGSSHYVYTNIKEL